MRVNAITPGVTDTDIQPPGRIERVAPMLPMGRAGQAEEVANAVLFLLSDGASYINGANLRVSGAALAVLALGGWLPMIAAEFDPAKQFELIQGE